MSSAKNKPSAQTKQSSKQRITPNKHAKNRDNNTTSDYKWVTGEWTIVHKNKKQPCNFVIKTREIKCIHKNKSANGIKCYLKIGNPPQHKKKNKRKKPLKDDCVTYYWDKSGWLPAKYNIVDNETVTQRRIIACVSSNGYLSENIYCSQPKPDDKRYHNNP